MKIARIAAPVAAGGLDRLPPAVRAGRRTRTRYRRAAAVATLTGGLVVTAAAASAEPVDVYTEHPVVAGTTGWTTAYWGTLVIAEAMTYDRVPTPEEVAAYEGARNADALDGALGVYVDDEPYGGTATSCDHHCGFVVDVTADGGDTVVTGPVDRLSGLDVAVEQRFFAEGDLARVLATFHNPATEPITVEVSVLSNYGHDDDLMVEADASGDGAVDASDRWFVTSDGGRGDPVVTTHLFGTHASLVPTTAETWDAGYSAAYLPLTVAPGETAHLAFFLAITGWHGDDGDDVLHAAELGSAAVLPSFADAVVAAATAAAAFSGTDDRAVAGLVPGTTVLNWGTVTGQPPSTPEPSTPEVPTPEVPAPAPPATPVVGRPSFTG